MSCSCAAAHWQAISHSLFANSPDANGQRAGFTPGAMAYFAFLYFLAMFIATFCNVAFYHEILAALGGEKVSLGRGFKFACSRLSSILMWTLFAGLIGLLVQGNQEKQAPADDEPRPLQIHRHLSCAIDSGMLQRLARALTAGGIASLSRIGATVIPPETAMGATLVFEPV